MVKNEEIIIRRFNNSYESENAARLIMTTDPWKTFGRTYENCLEAVTSPLKESYGAFMAEEFLGVLVIDLTGPFKGYIQAVCVKEKCRGMGLGSMLVSHAENRIFSMSPNCFLCFSDFNTEVKPFYEKLGYQMVGELKDYIIPGHSEFLLRKTISPTMNFKPNE